MIIISNDTANCRVTMSIVENGETISYGNVITESKIHEIYEACLSAGMTVETDLGFAYKTPVYTTIFRTADEAPLDDTL